MDIDYRLIGNRIQTKRKTKSLTQERLAELLDVTVGYVSQMERGIARPNLEMLCDISEQLGCDVAYLISGCKGSDPTYLVEEFFEGFAQLNARERRIVLALIDSMIYNR